jgi:hypothetical protein
VRRDPSTAASSRVKLTRAFSSTASTLLVCTTEEERNDGSTLPCTITSSTAPRSSAAAWLTDARKKTSSRGPPQLHRHRGSQ